MGHLGCADNPPDPCNGARAARASAAAWRRLARQACAPAVRHLAATAGTLATRAPTRCSIGAGLVGIDPSGHDSPATGADAHRADRGGRPGAGRRPRWFRAFLDRARG